MFCRVWTFLDYWGIINFCALDDPWRDGGGSSRPVSEGGEGPNALYQAVGPPGTLVHITPLPVPPGPGGDLLHSNGQ